MQVIRYDLKITVDSSGDFTGFITPVASGLIHQIRWVRSTLDVGADILITLEGTDLRVLNMADIGASATLTLCPRQVIHDNDDGTELVHSNDGTAATYDIDSTPVAVGSERIKVVISQGGDTAQGYLYVWIVS